MLAVMLAASTWAFAGNAAYAPREVQSPKGDVDAFISRNPKRVLNDRAFGGYLIWRQMPVFIDGRAELYGEKFSMAYYNALELKDVSQFLGLLRDHEIDGVLLQPGMPAAGLLNQLRGWRRGCVDALGDACD